VAAELPAHELIRGADTVYPLNSRQHLQVARVEVNPLAHSRQHRLARAGRAMHRKAHPHQVVGDVLNLVFGSGF